METNPTDPFEYIRNTYDVPAKAGMRVRIEFPLPGGEQTGTIQGADSRLLVLIDGEAEPRQFHPAWFIAYLNEDGTVAARFGDQ